MLANLGFYLLFLSMLCTLYSCGAALLAAFTRHRRLYLSSKLAVTVVTVLTTAAALLLVYLLFERDYSVVYIAKNSSDDLPALFTLTAFWSSLEGSHFLWTFL